METALVSPGALSRSARDDQEPSRWSTVRLSNGRLVRAFRNYRLDDIRGRPAGHPIVERVRPGKPNLAAEQVWVEKGTGELWVIAFLTYRADGECAASLRPYGCQIIMRRLAERTLRAQMRIWEDAVLYRQKLFSYPSIGDRVGV